MAGKLIAEAKLIADEDVGRNREMSKHGADWLIEELGRRGTPKLDEGGKVNVYAAVLLPLLLVINDNNIFSSLWCCCVD